ncbi:MAG TPA: chitobiase/beta-hexosaminidase C-terminal domain-containing protein [Acidobacteriaceae bacterium]|nr:chitobiase/beta-hexosaminidase C-terminal domain-containing protein [Acidobacteriaceae bacterium]
MKRCAGWQILKQSNTKKEHLLTNYPVILQSVTTFSWRKAASACLFFLSLFVMSTTQGWASSTYYMSPTGSDSNSGLSSSAPWLTPRHSLNCGDTIIAASGEYNNENLGRGDWGTVSCPAGNNVAWLQCATFDTCKVDVTAGNNQAIVIDQSYWGVQGWEASSSTSTLYGSCFTVSPSGSENVHHIIFANNIANSCATGGFSATARSASVSTDYITFIGNIAYNAAGTTVNGSCGSGFNIWEPIATDNNPGTHNFVAGNFSWNNFNGNPCAGTKPTDGEGFNFDTWDMSQSGGQPYTQQGVIENNISFLNGGYGIEVENNTAGSTHAPIYILHNTSYGNRRDMNEGYCTGNGDLDIYNSQNVTAEYNLIYSGYATNCSNGAFYGFAISKGNGTDTFDYNYASGVNGNNTFMYSSSGFTLGTHNTIGTDPSFADPVNPGAPECGGSASVPACMAQVIADYTPTVAAARSYGYQPVSLTNTPDPLYPQWLCNVTLPSGLVTPGCDSGTPPTAPTSPTSPTPPTAPAPPSTVAAPVFTPASQSFNGSITVSITTATAGATIYYTTNGTAPTSASTRYTGPFILSGSATVQALGVLKGDTNSAPTSATYTLNSRHHHRH